MEIPSLNPPDQQLDLFQVVPGSTPRLHWSASCQLGISIFQWFVSLALKRPNGERSIKYTCTYNVFAGA